MNWHLTHLPSFLHHLPHSLGDLVRHEDKALVKAGIGGFTVKAAPDIQKPRLILPNTNPAHGTPPSIAIEKDIDPAISRSQQNMELLVQDYLHTLPLYEPSSKEAEVLLEHWRKILLEQPQRIAEAKESYWHSGQARAFWQERIRGAHPDHVIYDDHWELAAGAAPAPPVALIGARQENQWRDLVIRNRLHNLTGAIYRSLEKAH